MGVLFVFDLNALMASREDRLEVLDESSDLDFVLVALLENCIPRLFIKPNQLFKALLLCWIGFDYELIFDDLLQVLITWEYNAIDFGYDLVGFGDNDFSMNR